MMNTTLGKQPDAGIRTSLYKTSVMMIVSGLALAVMAAEITWKGGGTTTAWSDGSNWEGGTAPTLGDTAIIPSGKTAGMSSVDVAYVSATDTKLAGISLPAADAELIVTNKTEVSLKVPLSGIGSVTVANNGGGMFTFGANNYDFTGPMTFTNSNVATSYTQESNTHRHFGRDNTVTVTTDNTAHSQLYFFATGTYQNNFLYIGPSGDNGQQYSLSYAYGTINFANTVVVTNFFKFNQQQGGTVTFSGGIDHGGQAHVQIMGNRGVIKSGGTSRFKSSDAISDMIKYGYYGYHTGFAVANKATVDLYDEVTSDSTRLAITDGTLRFQGANRLPQNVELQVGNPAGNTVCSGTFDLNGYDQQCGTIYLMNPGDTMVVTSSVPATLTCYGQFEIRGSGPKANNWLSFALDGKASFVLNATKVIGTPQGKVTDYNATFTNKTSNTSGFVRTQKGRITLGGNTSWPNVSRLEVVDKGTMKIDTANINPNFALVVSNVADKAVTVGTDLTAKTMYADEWLQPGVYGGADAGLDDAHTLKQLTGTGKVTVTKFGGPKGLAFIVR